MRASKRIFPERDVSVVDLSQDFSVSEAVHAWEDLPDVEYAEPNFLLKPASVSNASSFDQMYVVNNTGQTVGTPDEDIDVFEA